MKPYIVGIAGGTASGKTTIAADFSERWNATLIGHDRYYRDIPHPRGFNFDHPDALETTLLVEHLDQLRSGHAADLPIYVFGAHHRGKETERVEPRPLMVVEGILVLQDERLRCCFDLMVFVDAPADIRLIRRLRRDITDRGRTIESVLDQYEATVRPMHEQFVQPTAAFASLVLDGMAPPEASVQKLADAVEAGRRARGV